MQMKISMHYMFTRGDRCFVSFVNCARSLRSCCHDRAYINVLEWQVGLR